MPLAACPLLLLRRAGPLTPNLDHYLWASTRPEPVQTGPLLLRKVAASVPPDAKSRPCRVDWAPAAVVMIRL